MSIGKNVFYSLLTQVPNFVFGMAAGILSTRILGPEGKGYYSIFFYDVAFLSLLLNLGMGFAIVYFVSNQKYTVDKVFGIALMLAAVNLSLLAGILATVWHNPSIDFLFPEGHRSMFYVAYLAGAFTLAYLNTIFTSIFQGIKRFGTVNRLTLFKSALNALLFGGAFWAKFQWGWDIRVKEVLMISLGLYVLEFLFWLLAYIRRIGLWPMLRVRLLQELSVILGFSMIGYLSNLLNFLNYRLDIWLVEHFRDIRTLGLYVLAVNITQLFWLISEPISKVILPFLNDRNLDNVSEKFSLYARLNSTVILVASLMAWVLAEWLVPWVYGAEFTPSVAPLRILLIGNYFICLSKIYAVYTTVNKQVKHNLIATAVGLVLTVVFDLLLIPRYGALGAAWASNVAYLGIFGYVFIICTSYLKLPLNNQFFLTLRDIRTLRNNTP